MPTKKPPLLALYIKFLIKDGTLSGFTGESGDLMTKGAEYTDLAAIDDECGDDEIVGGWRIYVHYTPTPTQGHTILHLSLHIN